MKTKARASKAFVWILGILVLWGGELYSANPAARGDTAGASNGKGAGDPAGGSPCQPPI